MLQTLALELGFDAANWVSARIPDAEVRSFMAWLEAGHHAGMDYLERSVARRANLTSTFAPTRAVLMLMVSHNHAAPAKPVGGTRVGRVARYAWSRDYHQALSPVLRQLEDAALRLRVRAKATLDHAPIFERGLAARAGLGWFGRSSQLIHTKLGALTRVGVLLTDLESPEETASHPDRCGKCTACAAACPTNAILPNRQVDSRRCIAYYTVEHRGSIPLELRAGFGEHLFGCDDCLDVCPWTSHSGVFSRLLEPIADYVYPDLEPFFLQSGTWFERQYAQSAFIRTRRKGMARNAAIVLGNLKNPEHLWLLEKGLSDVALEVRESCAWALEQYGSDQANRILERYGLVGKR